MDEVFKYHKFDGIQSGPPSANESISAIQIKGNFLSVGTDKGIVFVYSTTNGECLKQYKAHDSRVNDLSFDFHSQILLRYCFSLFKIIIFNSIIITKTYFLFTKFSCSDDGNVVLKTLVNDGNVKDSIIKFGEPIRAICFEDKDSQKKDKSFIVGKSKQSIIINYLLL